MSSFFFNDTATTEIYTLSLHDALPICNFLASLFLSQGVPMLLGGDEFGRSQRGNNNAYCQDNEITWYDWDFLEDRKSTRLNSSHANISYAVFCLKKKNILNQNYLYSHT